MKIKNYRWSGFGFPVIFEELPAVKLRGEVIPDVDWDKLGKLLLQHLCVSQQFQFSGNEIKFARGCLSMSLREFAKFAGVTHQSVMRWESQDNKAALIGTHVETILRMKILKKLKGTAKDLSLVMDQFDNIEKSKLEKTKIFSPIKIEEKWIHQAVLAS